MRFLARRVYLGVVVVLASMLRCGPSPSRIATLSDSLGVSERTLARWRRWWRRDFVASAFWRVERGLLGGDLDEERLPASLIERFLGQDRMQAMLRFLSPICGGKGLAERVF